MTPPPDSRLQDEIHLKVLRQLQQNPEQTQRELAESLGVSLGKANYCVQALLAKGLLKIGNFHRQKNKRVYTYLLTPEGLAAKAALTARFLKRKMEEYDLLSEEIQQLRAEVASQHPSAHAAERGPKDASNKPSVSRHSREGGNPAHDSSFT